MVLSNLTGFLLVPIVIGYLDVTKYGIWLTINSSLAWVFLFDLGLGGGLRTRMAQALAKQDIEEANILINTCYAAISIIMLTICGAYYLIAPHINWTGIFNAQPNVAHELNQLMLVVVLFFLARFVLQLVNGMFTAIQRNSVTNIIVFCSQLLALSMILLLGKQMQGSLFWIGFIYSAAPCLVFIVFTIVFFTTFRQFKLNPKYIRFSALKRVLHIGVFEFIDQIAFVVLMSATNLIIAQVSSPAEVVPYHIIMRIFGIFLTVYTLATNPLIPAFTEAHTLNDHAWIKRVITKANWLFVICALGIALAIPFSRPIFNILVKGKAEVSLALIVTVIIITLLRLFNNVYTKFLTGCGKVRLQALISATSAVLYITFVFLFGKRWDIGVEGVLMAQIAVGAISTVFVFIQSQKVIANKARGLWAR